MGFLLSLLTNKYVIVGLIIAAIVAGGTFYITGLKNDITKLEASNKVLTSDLQVSQASVKTLQGAIADQNVEVEKFKADADERLKAGAIAVAAAKTVANNYKVQAAAILSAKIPQNTNTCNAANDLFNTEIQNAQ